MYTKKRSAQNMKNIIIYIIMIAVFFSFFAFIINHYFVRQTKGVINARNILRRTNKTHKKYKNIENMDNE